MARIERTEATGKIPVKQAQLIDPGAFRFSTSVARAVQGAGATLTQMSKEERAVKQELAKRKLAMKDKIGTSDSKALMRDAEQEYAKKIETAPLEEHEAIRQKQINAAKFSIAGLELSPDARELVENDVDIWSNDFDDTAELANIQEVQKTASVRVIDDYEQSLIEAGGDLADPNFLKAEEALDDHFKNLEPSEAKILKRKANERAVKQIESDANTEIRELATRVPQEAIKRIETEQAQRKKGKEEDFPLVSNEDLQSAKKLAESTIVSIKNQSQEKFDLAVGQATTTVTDGIRERTVTENDIWTMEVDVPLDKQGDLGKWRNTWAGIIRNIETRTRKKQDGTDKKNREDAYDPELVASLKTEARNAESPTDVADIKRRASVALGENKIDDADLETISVNADKTFQTAVDEAVDTGDTELRRIILKGTSTESLTPWLQSQIVSITATGRKIAAGEVTDLIQTFQFVGKAKTWAAGEARRAVELEIEQKQKDKKPMTLDDVRKLSLETQKVWLRKTDTELTEEYRAWLKQKP